MQTDNGTIGYSIISANHKVIAKRFSRAKKWGNGKGVRWGDKWKSMGYHGIWMGMWKWKMKGKGKKWMSGERRQWMEGMECVCV